MYTVSSCHSFDAGSGIGDAEMHPISDASLVCTEWDYAAEMMTITRWTLSSSNIRRGQLNMIIMKWRMSDEW